MKPEINDAHHTDILDGNYHLEGGFTDVHVVTRHGASSFADVAEMLGFRQHDGRWSDAEDRRYFREGTSGWWDEWDMNTEPDVDVDELRRRLDEVNRRIGITAVTGIVALTFALTTALLILFG